MPYPILVGYLGYPMIKYMENIKLNNPDNINIPEATLIRPKVVAVFDNIKDTISLMTLTYPSKKISAIKAYDEANNILEQTVKKLQKNSVDLYFNEISFENKLDFKSNYTKQEYFKIIEKAKKYIEQGDIFQVVTSQRFETKYDLKAIHL